MAEHRRLTAGGAEGLFERCRRDQLWLAAGSVKVQASVDLADASTAAGEMHDRWSPCSERPEEIERFDGPLGDQHRPVLRRDPGPLRWFGQRA